MTDATATVGIYEKRIELERLDREMRTNALREVSAKNKPLFADLYAQCGEITGHKFKFDHYNFNREYKYYKCEYCGETRGEDHVK